MSACDDHLEWLQAASDGAPTAEELTSRLMRVSIDHARQAREQGDEPGQQYHQIVAGQTLIAMRLASLEASVTSHQQAADSAAARVVERLVRIEGACPGLEGGE